MQHRLGAGAIALACLATCLPQTAQAQSPESASAVQAASSVMVRGTLIDQQSEVAISGAQVTVYRNGVRAGSAVTDKNGAFGVAVPGSGSYYVAIDAHGYQSARSSDVLAPAGQQSISFSLAIVRAASGQGTREIGSVATSSVAALQTSATVTRDLSTTTAASENYPRVGEALTGMPGLNAANGSASVGDDFYINIRGLGQSETQTLLDGHPIGPIGVEPGATGGFDYEDSPMFALKGVQVTYGAGALGLYGTDSTGGTINLETIDPTATPQGSITQRFGTFGESQTGITTTGTVGKLGYALVHGRQTSYGLFANGEQLQNGDFPLNGNLAPATYQKWTLPVSGDTSLSNDLVKLRYAFSSVSTLTLTGYDANTIEDKTGTGNNYNPYAYNLYQIQHSKTLQGSCPAGDVQVTTGAPTTSCYTDAQYAQALTGPSTSEGWQGIGNQDYHARFTTQAGSNSIVVDGFVDNYGFQYNRNLSTPGSTTGPFYQDLYRTTGLLVSDDISMRNNEFGFGYYLQHQHFGGTTYSAPYTVGGVQGGGVLVPLTNETQNENSFFIRDEFTPAHNLSLITNAWYKHDDATNSTSFDPRASLIFRPTSNDVVRLTGGKSTGEPDPGLAAGNLTAPTTLNSTFCGTVGSAGSTTCTGTGKALAIGTIGNSALSPVQASDYEIAYGHRFTGDTQIQLDYYNTHETNTLFTSNVPASTLPGAVPTSDLVSICTRLGCPAGYNPSDLLPYLTLSQAVNVGTELARGFELSGRYRVNRHLFFDGSYNIQSSAQYDIPTSLLVSNPYIINGGQIEGIPLHEGSLSVDETIGGFEARLDGHYIGSNNIYDAPAFTYFDLGLNQQIGKRTTFNIGVRNLFNNNSGLFDETGLGMYIPENGYAPQYANAFAEGAKLRVMTPASISFAVTERF
ncbi:MAG TPA: TonB-dependent receptor [Candidatus Limnocylindria bacterium]|nr:TonB-dependent receptor [Candidatus Limnocylindria bacterium]